jgi:hypothetical protein
LRDRSIEFSRVDREDSSMPAIRDINNENSPNNKLFKNL